MSKEEQIIGLLKGNNEGIKDPADENPGIYGYTAAVTRSDTIVGGKADFLKGGEVTDKTVVNVASITKMFTAATVLKMTEHEDYKEQFPGGVDTPLKHFEADLRKNYPDNTEFFDYLKEQQQYGDLTLRHLMQHTHGLGSRTPACFGDILADTGKQWGAADALKSGYLKADNDKGEFGKHEYSNTGYDLLGAIIETTASKAKGRKVSYESMVREEVIDPLGLTNTYTSEDKIPDSVPVAHGYIDNQGKGLVEQDHPDRFTFAAGMLRSTPSDINKFSQAFLTEDIDRSMFQEQSTIAAMNKDADKHGYGLGFKVFKDGDKTYKGHDGMSWGVQSVAMFDPETEQAASYVQVSETVSENIARAVLSSINPEVAPKKHQAAAVREQQKGLLSQYSPQQLVDRREKIIQETPLEVALQSSLLDREGKKGRVQNQGDGSFIIDYKPYSPSLESKMEQVHKSYETPIGASVQSEDARMINRRDRKVLEDVFGGVGTNGVRATIEEKSIFDDSIQRKDASGEPVLTGKVDKARANRSGEIKSLHVRFECDQGADPGKAALALKEAFAEQSKDLGYRGQLTTKAVRTLQHDNEVRHQTKYSIKAADQLDTRVIDEGKTQNGTQQENITKLLQGEKKPDALIVHHDQDHFLSAFFNEDHTKALILDSLGDQNMKEEGYDKQRNEHIKAVQDAIRGAKPDMQIYSSTVRTQGDCVSCGMYALDAVKQVNHGGKSKLADIFKNLTKSVEKDVQLAASELPVDFLKNMQAVDDTLKERLGEKRDKIKTGSDEKETLGDSRGKHTTKAGERLGNPSGMHNPERRVNTKTETMLNKAQNRLRELAQQRVQGLDALDLEIKPNQLERVDKTKGLVPATLGFSKDRRGTQDIPNPQKEPLPAKINADSVQKYGKAAAGPTSRMEALLKSDEFAAAAGGLKKAGVEKTGEGKPLTGAPPTPQNKHNLPPQGSKGR